MSSSPSISKPMDASGGMRPKGWRKPVPKLIPDPPRKPQSVSRSSSFRHLVLLPTNEPQPPMPDNWREIMDKAQGKAPHVERPGRPSPRNSSRTDVSTPECGAAPKDVSSVPRRRGSRGEEKALPTLPDTHVRQRLSDAGSTLSESTTSTTVEPSAEHPTDALKKSSQPANDLPVARPQSPPPAPEHEQRGQKTDANHRIHDPYDLPYRIIYPQGLNCSNLDVTRRHVAVFPSSPRKTAGRDDLSADMTAFETLEETRSVRHPYGSSVMLDKVPSRRPRPRHADANVGCLKCGHILRGLVHRRAKSTPRVKY